VTCHKFQIDGAAAAIRKMLPLIFSREQGAHFGTAPSTLWQGVHCIRRLSIMNVFVVLLAEQHWRELPTEGRQPVELRCAAERRPENRQNHQKTEAGHSVVALQP